MKKLIMIVVIILVIALAFSFTKNIIAKTAISAGVKAITGLKLSMRSMNVGIVNTLIGIRGLELFNPPAFKDRLMVSMPEIYVDYDLGSFLKGKVHLEEVKLNLKEFVVVKNEKGELNLDSLKMVKEKKEKQPSKEAKAPPKIQIDALELKIGKVLYKDYSAGSPPKVREFNVNINERYENITNPYALGSLIVFKALMNTTIANLADFDLGPLTDELGETLGKASKMAQEAASKITGEATGKALEASKELGVKAQESAGEAAEKVKETLKGILPFGSGGE